MEKKMLLSRASFLLTKINFLSLKHIVNMEIPMKKHGHSHDNGYFNEPWRYARVTRLLYITLI